MQMQQKAAVKAKWKEEVTNKRTREQAVA